MSEIDDKAWLGGWEGYEVRNVERIGGVSPEIWIYLTPVPLGVMICGGCGGETRALHDMSWRRVRDLPILDARTWVVLLRRRVRCAHCGPKLERLSWLAPHARVTERLAESVARLCRVLPVKQVADFFALGWDAVKAIDKRRLAARLDPPDLGDIEVIAMDEFALHKGHRYATVVVEPRRKRVLWVGAGRSRASLRPFFRLLGKKGCRRLKAVAMDMSAAFEQEVRHNCPQADIVWDLFHVVAKYGREVIDRVRVDEANRLRHDKPARKLIKGARWLLLRNRDTIEKPEDRVRLDELLAANHDLMVVYVLKDDLKGLWRLRRPQDVREAWHDWLQRAEDSGIEALIAFARKLEKYIDGIVAHAQWPLNTSLLEGINNKIKVIKRMAYGFRDEDYFFLKIRAAFPGIHG